MNMNQTVVVLGDSGDRATPSWGLETARIRIDEQSAQLLASAPKLVQQLVEYFVRKASEERDIIIEVIRPTPSDPIVYVNGKLVAIWV